MYWEVHITIGKSFCSAAHAVKLLGPGWKHSQIDGDPQLGPGVKQYATKNYPHTMTAGEVQRELNQSAQFFRERNWLVLREKIELVMYDTKGKKK